MRELDQFRTKPADARVAPPIVQDVLHSQGEPLGAKIRRSMEPHFGHDFGNVRVHTDERAAASASAVDARAYAAGSNIVFARGQFSPDTKPGRQLLAHELAHTVQQRNSGPPAGAPPISDPGSHAESEADGAAKAVAANRAASVTSSAPVIARQPAGSDTKEKAAEPTNLEQVEQALTKFFKDINGAFPNDSLPQNSRVVTEVLRIAGASRAPERVGPVKTVSPAEVQAKMRDFLKDILAPKDPEGLAKAVVRRLPGPVDPAEIDHLKSLDVLKPDQPKGIPGVVDRYQKLAPADLPPKDPQAVSDQQKQDAAMATQRSNPTLSPPLDPWRVGKAFAGGKDQTPDHSEHQYPPVPKPDEPYRPGVVNKDIKIASTLPSLTVDRAIHFQVNQPGALALDDKSLKASLTPGGVGGGRPAEVDPLAATRPGIRQSN